MAKVRNKQIILCSPQDLNQDLPHQTSTFNTETIFTAEITFIGHAWQGLASKDFYIDVATASS